MHYKTILQIKLGPFYPLHCSFNFSHVSSISVVTLLVC